MQKKDKHFRIGGLYEEIAVFTWLLFLQPWVDSDRKIIADLETWRRMLWRRATYLILTDASVPYM